ncbi:hypothetical protein L7842_000915 [Providencia rettgeri]|uniref:hypothetical protein n=1 Tax=Providencia rettgeri TaxID=587 RepID=UPI001EE71029|nr:hypothetical protein [Providencia rettgeri]MCG5290048.1 hypothetical protein [Providencia rettgeri]
MTLMSHSYLTTRAGWMALLNSQFVREYAPHIKNSHQLMVANIRFPDNDSTPAIAPCMSIPLN